MPALRLSGLMAALALTAACNVTNTDAPPQDERIFALSGFSRGYALAFSEYPFERGTIDIVATEGGQLRSFRMVVCREGQAICAGGIHGPAGELTQEPDYWIVRGLFEGRTFYLSPGGDGAIYYGTERAAALAWNNAG
jgi:hypothetical protein